jgi:hypothetical protein
MKILDRLPVDDEHDRLDIHGEALRIRPFQIIVQVSISDRSRWDARTPIIPALLDTGNNHNFSIQENHLARWVGVHPQSLPFLGAIREGGRTPSLRFANVWIHRNRSGRRDLRYGEPFLLPLEEGIAIYPDDGSNYPRLPLLGLRAIIKNNLKLVIDGKRKYVSLSSPAW